MAKFVYEVVCDSRGKEIEVVWNYGPEAPSAAEIDRIIDQYFPGVPREQIRYVRPDGDLGPVKRIHLTNIF